MGSTTTHHIFTRFQRRRDYHQIGDRFVKGQAPSKVIRKLNEFIDTHEKELLALWEKAQRGETIEKIQH